MRFVHIADTHLGKVNFKLDERLEDFKKSFKNFIDLIINKNIDFVVHSGDLFDKPNPTPDILSFTVEQLLRLKEKNIPIYIIPGSHDIGVDGTYLSVLEKLGLVKNVASSKYFYKNDNNYVLTGIVDKKTNTFIAGIPGRRSKIKNLLENLKIEFPKDVKFKIFMFHHTITDISSLFGDFPKSLLPKGFNYYAAGHWHGKIIVKYDKGEIVYPGSTEYCDSSEMLKNEEKGFYIIDVDNTNSFTKYFIPLKTRKVIVKKINVNNLSPDQATQLCMSQIFDVDDNPILIFKLDGKLKSGNRSEIDKSKINIIAKEKGYLFSNVLTSDVLNPEQNKITIVSKSVEEIEKEYLKKKNFDDKIISLVQNMFYVMSHEKKEEEIKSKILDMIRRDLLHEDKEH